MRQRAVDKFVEVDPASRHEGNKLFIISTQVGKAVSATSGFAVRALLRTPENELLLGIVHHRTHRAYFFFQIDAGSMVKYLYLDGFSYVLLCEVYPFATAPLNPSGQRLTPAVRTSACLRESTRPVDGCCKIHIRPEWRAAIWYVYIGDGWCHAIQHSLPALTSSLYRRSFKLCRTLPCIISIGHHHHC